MEHWLSILANPAHLLIAKEASLDFAMYRTVVFQVTSLREGTGGSTICA